MKPTTEHFRYTKTHEWLNTEDTPMTLGITAHAQNLLGDIVFIELPALNTEVKAGQEIGVLESVKAASDYYAPIGGVISKINEEIIANPALINQDPYGKGWICQITPHPSATLDILLNEESYNQLIAE